MAVMMTGMAAPPAAGGSHPVSTSPRPTAPAMKVGIPITPGLPRSGLRGGGAGNVSVSFGNGCEWVATVALSVLVVIGIILLKGPFPRRPAVCAAGAGGRGGPDVPWGLRRPRPTPVRQCSALPVLLALLAVVSRCGLRETNEEFDNAFLLGFLQPEGAFDFVEPELVGRHRQRDVHERWPGREAPGGVGAARRAGCVLSVPTCVTGAGRWAYGTACAGAVAPCP